LRNWLKNGLKRAEKTFTVLRFGGPSIEPTSVIKKTFRAIERDREDVQKRKVDFLEETKNIDAKNLVFLDETGSNLNMMRTHARSLVNKRAFCKKSAKRHQNISVVGAIGLSGFKHVYPFDGAVDEEKFLSYLDNLLPKLSDEQILIMDNVRFHHCKSVKEKIQKAGIRLIYLPPYHPELNPIEEAWSCVKRTLRSLKARTISAYTDALSQAIENVTPGKIKGFFEHAGYSDQPA